MKDKTLFPLPKADGNLTSKQQFVLDILQVNPNGMRAIGIGWALHRSRDCPYCQTDRTCAYAARDANTVLDQLGTSGRQLVIRRKTGLWQLTPQARPRDSGSFPDDF